MIKQVSRRTARQADIYTLASDWEEMINEANEYHGDYPPQEVDVKFIPANPQYGQRECYVVYIDGELEGDFEYCTECEAAWISFAGDCHDEEYCIYCGSLRD